MPVGTNATVKALDPDDLVEVGALDHPGQHLPPVPAPGPRADRAARRPAPVHGLGPADPDRLGRLPGRVAGRPARRRRRRRDVPQPPRRLDPPASRPSTRSRSRRRSASDIAVAFDQPVPPARRRARGRRGRDRRGRIAGPSARWPPTSRPRPGAVRHHPGRARAGPARAESTRFIAALPFDGICIGGLAGDETPAQRATALDVVVPLLADDPRPRYLMGLGSPVDLLDAVDAGVDLFDSVLPARVARTGQVWVPDGRLNLRNAALPRRPGADPGGLPLPRLPALLAGLPGPPVPGATSCSRTGSRLVTT